EFRRVLFRSAPYSVVWDTSLVPDQEPGEVKLVARVLDGNGVWHVTSEVANLTLERDTKSVRLYRAFDVPEVWWVRAGQSKSCHYLLPWKDDLSSATSAKLPVSPWTGINCSARPTRTTELTPK